MGQAKRKRDAAALAAQLSQQVDLSPLTNPEVKAAVLAHMVRTGLLKLPGPR